MLTLYTLEGEIEREKSGPLHAQVKSRDHDIVRAQKKVSKGRSKALPKSCVTLKCNVKSYVTGPSTECCLNEFSFMQVLTHDKIE